MTPFFCALWECPRKADAVLVSAFFVSGSHDFIIFSFVPVAYDDFSIRVSGEPSRASDERNDFLILTNEQLIRFYYLFRGRTSRAIFLY